MGYPNKFGPNGFMIYNNEQVKTVKLITRPVLAGRAVVAGATESVLCVGDPYTLDANGNAAHAGPGSTIAGVVAAIGLNALSQPMAGQGPISQEVLLQQDAGYIIGYENIDIFFEVQSDNFTTAMIGGSFNLVDALYFPLLRQSRVSISTAAAGTQFKAIDIANRPTDNAYGQWARVIVRCLTVAS